MGVMKDVVSLIVRIKDTAARKMRSARKAQGLQTAASGLRTKADIGSSVEGFYV